MVYAGCVVRRGIQGDMLVGVADKQQASRLMHIAVFRVFVVHLLE